MTSQQQDEHWFILSIGTLARTLEAGMSFAAAYAAVMIWENAQESEHNAALLILSFFVLAFVLNLILIFIHEMGHACAAWSVGRRVHIICVGLLGFLPNTRKFIWINKPEAAEYAGFVQSSPIWPDLSRRKSMWVSFGGPFLTFIIGLSLVLISGHGEFSLPLKILAVFFLLDAFINLLPMRWSAETSSDGLHILQYLQGNLWTPDVWAGTRLSMEEYEGQLVSDAEWHDLRAYVRQPFFGGPKFRELLRLAARQKNDVEMIDALGFAHVNKK